MEPRKETLRLRHGPEADDVDELLLECGVGADTLRNSLADLLDLRAATVVLLNEMAAQGALSSYLAERAESVKKFALRLQWLDIEEDDDAREDNESREQEAELELSESPRADFGVRGRV